MVLLQKIPIPKNSIYLLLIKIHFDMQNSNLKSILGGRTWKILKNYIRINMLAMMRNLREK